MKTTYSDNAQEVIVQGLTDCQLINVVSSVQNYTDEQTYMYAHSQVGVQGDPWDKWSRNFSLMPTNKLQLPFPVRIELQEAIGKFILEGRLKVEHFTQVLEANTTWEERQGLLHPQKRHSSSRLLNYIMLFIVFYTIISIFIY